MGRSGRDARGLTLRDIAHAANVSVGAVSQALNNTGALNPDTRARIRSIADELGYVPNQFAAALRRRRSMAIGFVTASSGEQNARHWASAHGTQLSALVRAAADIGYSVTVLPDDRPELVASSQVDAIYVPDAMTGDLVVAAAETAQIPIVTNDATRRHERSIYVNIGIAEATRFALEQLVAGGSQRPALLTGPVTAESAEGEQAYLVWCDQHEIAPIIGSGCTDQDQLEQTAIEVVRSGADSIFSLAAQGPNILIGLSRDGVVLPRDLQLIALCIDECSVNQRLDIGHICVHPEHAPALALTAVLEALSSDGNATREITVPWEFHAGATVRPAQRNRA
ncbi:MAG: LacI family DNA-binding transcriptional regulator [Agromyces sp.]